MIDLTRCDDFALGPATVRPPTRELIGASGTATVEPKVMQVLVALAHADGRVVSRDDLVAQCWQGRVVGDDAINRMIGKLRRALDAAGAPARIENIARIGYRLVVQAPAAEPRAPSTAAPAPAVPATSGAGVFPVRVRYRSVGITMAAVASAVALIAWLTLHPLASSLPAVGDLETRGLAAMFDDLPERSADALYYLRQATALEPRRGPLWGSLAMAYVIDLGWVAPGARAGVAARAREAATRGLALDQADTRSAAALVALQPTFGHWMAKGALIDATVRRTGGDRGPLAYQRVQFLMGSGRTREALTAIEPLARGSALVPWIQAARIDLLAAAGQLDAAERAADAARAIWPRDRLIWFTAFDLAAFGGTAEKALAMAEDREGWPAQVSAAEMKRTLQTAQALVARGTVKTSALLDGWPVATQADAERKMRVAAALGRADVALTAARLLLTGHLPASPRATMLPLIGQPDNGDPPTAALFLPPVAPLLSTPEFAALLRDSGLGRISGASSRKP